MENQDKLTMSEEQINRLGDKYISEGTGVTDNETSTKYKICKIEDDGILLKQVSSFSNHPKAEIKVSFDEFLRKYDAKEISVNGYTHELPDQIILHQVVGDITANASIGKLTHVIGELTIEEVEFKSGGVVGKISFSKNGYVREIRNQYGKLIPEVTVDGKIYRRNTVHKTYNSTGTNELLYKSDSDKIQIMKAGGIANQYEGKTPEQIWKLWDYNQRFNFWNDHADLIEPTEIQYGLGLGGRENWLRGDYDGLPTDIKDVLQNHISDGQYKKGAKVKGKEIDVQQEGKVLVGREVYANQNALVEKLLSDEIIPIDDIQNYFRPAEEGEEEEQPQEIMEWWLVSDWLKDKLLANGQPIIDNDLGTWWGRTTSGQAIYMNGVIQNIVKEIHSRKKGGKAAVAKKEDEGYQGWKNYETWNVKLWMDNDAGSYNYWDERTTEIAKESKKDEYSTKKDVAIRTLADELKEYHEENNPLADQASTYSDLLGSALDNVSWREIAESLLENKMKRGGSVKGGDKAEINEDNFSEEYKREYISQLLMEGNTSGYDPVWKLKTDFEGELDDSDLEHIAKLVYEGYTSGEIISSDELKQGWWNIDIMKTGGKVDITKNYYRFRQESPANVTECAIPEWAQKVAEATKKGAKITTCKKDGKWMIQSILIPKQGVKQAEANAMAEEIKSKFSRKKKALGGTAESCTCDDIEKTIEGLEALRDTTSDESEKKRYQELIDELN